MATRTTRPEVPPVSRGDRLVKDLRNTGIAKYAAAWVALVVTIYALWWVTNALGGGLLASFTGFFATLLIPVAAMFALMLVVVFLAVSMWSWRASSSGRGSIAE